MIYYQDAAEAILREGFRDGTGSYGFATITLTGVFLADTPVDINEGATGDQVLAVEIADDSLLADYEFVTDGTPSGTYREWCVPAEIINTHGRVRLLTDDEVDELARKRWLAF